MNFIAQTAVAKSAFETGDDNPRESPSFNMISGQLESTSGLLLNKPLSKTVWQSYLDEIDKINQFEAHQGASFIPDFSVRVAEVHLQRYPYLSAYWNRLGSRNAHNQKVIEAEEALRQSLNYLDYDTASWIRFLRLKLLNTHDDRNHLLELFEEARYKVGWTFYSSELYSLYFSFVMQNFSLLKGHDRKVKTLGVQLVTAPLYNQAGVQSQFQSVISSKDAPLANAYNENVLNQRIYNSMSLPFERELLKWNNDFRFHNTPNVWRRYTEAMKDVAPTLLMISLFERGLLCTSFSNQLVEDYIAFLLELGMVNRCKSILKRALHQDKTTNHIRYIVRLAKLEIYEGNYASARDYIAQAIGCNGVLSHELEELIIFIEELF